MEILEPIKWGFQIERIISKIPCWIADFGMHTVRSERFFRSWNPRTFVKVWNNEPDNDGRPALTHDHSVYHTRTHFCENWVVFHWEAQNQEKRVIVQTRDRYILHVFISICLCGCYWASRTAVSIEKGVSVSSKIRERGVFFKLGYEHGIRFGRERDAGDGVSEGEFTKALLLTQTTNHMPGKVWD